ncbi:MAG: YitT family protein [Prevotella micans]|jgi:putative membrane protein|nr:YitT family protein [Prevotella micans]
MSENIKQKTFREFKEFLYITLTTAVGSFGWCAFLLPHKIPIGGISGLASVIFWGIDIPIEYTYFILNIILLLVALKVLGWRFCIRTIYTVFIFATLLTLFQRIFSAAPLLPTNPFLSCIIGGILMGFGMGVALQYNASTGGSDVIAAMIHKYRNVSLGKIILSCDLVIITSSYLALHNWENVIYGFVVLFVMTFVVDYVANGMNGSVQFFIVSDKWEEIGHKINNKVQRGCTVIDAHGFYTGKTVGMLFIIARRSESHSIYETVDEIDPQAFVSQSTVNGVYGVGFDRMKVGRGHKS